MKLKKKNRQLSYISGFISIVTSYSSWKILYTDFCDWLIFLQIMVYKNWKLILLKWLSKIDYRIVFLCLYVRKQFHDRLLHHSRKKAYILFSMTWYKIMLSIWYPVIRIIDCNSTEHHESIIFSVFIILSWMLNHSWFFQIWIPLLYLITFYTLLNFRPKSEIKNR